MTKLYCCENKDRRNKHHHAQGIDPLKPVVAPYTGHKFTHDSSTTKAVCKRMQVLGKMGECLAHTHGK